VAALAATSPAQASRADCTPEAGWPAQDAGLAQQVVGLVNAHRASLGLQPVQISQTLTNAAAWKAGQLGYDVGTSGAAAFAHNDYLTNRDPVARLQACGWAGNFGENIALGQADPQAVMDAWLASTEGHRENIENPAWRAIGVGAAPGGAAGPGWVQEFSDSLPDPIATPVASLAPLAPATTAPTVTGPLPPPIEGAAAATAQGATGPDIAIVARPKSRTRKRTARIRWSVSGQMQQISCSLNGKPLKRCGPTGRTLRVRGGRHVFRVTVSGPAGADSAQVSWRVLRR
jgi:uncharacterized protein YkwD